MKIREYWNRFRNWQKSSKYEINVAPTEEIEEEPPTPQ